jgi:hypothetical protein
MTPHLIPALAAVGNAAATDATPAFHYSPFLTPLPVWGDGTWPWLLVPLCVCVAVVYKSIKCRTMSQVPKEATGLVVWILAGMAVAAVVLALVVEALERANT